MTKLDHALHLSSLGFHVFPIKENTKDSPYVSFPTQSTRDEKIIKAWWATFPNANIGISTSKFNESEALLVIDIDNKEDKMGEDEIFRLENVEGYDFPITCEQDTPTGGRHLIYKLPTAIKQSTSKIGRGIDTRSKGGYIVGAGSVINGREYKIRVREVVTAPEKLVEFFDKNSDIQKSVARPVDASAINQDFAISRAIEFIESSACPKCTVGSRNANSYQVACRLKDFGVTESKCFELIRDYWAIGEFEASEILAVCSSAFKYGDNTPGSGSPEGHPGSRTTSRCRARC